MFPSYNHNMAYGGHTFHVQTEVSRSVDATLVTHLFLAGDIIATTRVPLGDLTGTAVIAAMQKQHQDVMRALIAGTHDAALAARGVTLTPVARG